MPMRTSTLVLLLLTGILQYDLWLGKNGISDYKRMSINASVGHKVNDKIRAFNKEMHLEIEDLRQELDAIEERARHELGMIKAGETFYRIIRKKSDIE